LPQLRIRTTPGSVSLMLALVLVASGCGSKLMDTKPAIVEPARAAVSPTPATAPFGQVLALGAGAQSALFDNASASLVVFASGTVPQAPATLTIFGPTGAARTVVLPGAASAIAGDGQGAAYASTRGGFYAIDLIAGTATPTPINGESATDFTAIARRADGRLVLGSADGVAYTLAADLTVSATSDIFARVDAIVTEGDTAVVLDRGQTSVTALNPAGSPDLALRAGLGATTIDVDPVGRVLVADTRGGQLLVFGADPLIERQAYPVGESPYGVVGSKTLVWVSQTATNQVIGYDLATGIPVEKMRYPTVQQPNSLAYDDASGTLYVVSGSGGGVQVIRNAAGGR
jgi:DNA-binding beta-propeller fold protein YncE